jgi:hypothetical protein
MQIIPKLDDRMLRLNRPRAVTREQPQQTRVLNVAKNQLSRASPPRRFRRRDRAFCCLRNGDGGHELPDRRAHSQAVAGARDPNVL